MDPQTADESSLSTFTKIGTSHNTTQENITGRSIKSQFGAAKKVSTRKLYSLCVVMCCAFIVCLVLNNVTPLTVYTMAKDSRGASIYGKFYHLETNDENKEKETFVSLFDKNVHIYSAIAYNSTNVSVFDIVHLSGWENRTWSRFYKPNFTCCLVYGHRENDILVTRLNLLEKHDWYYVGRAKLEVKQYLCPNVVRKNHGRNISALAVSLGLDNQCPKNHSKYIKIDYPQKQPSNKLAVCAKLVYGNISAASIVEWFEYHRLMGVSKVMVYTYKLNPAAMSVLQYYKSIGLCDHFPFTLPPIGDKERPVGVKNFQGWNDEQVPVYDCQGKLSGYTYLGLFDVDEYIHPTNGSDLLNLLSTLRRNHPRAAGFMMKTEIYATTWGQDNGTDTVRDITMGMYTMRTEAYRDREKSVVINNRLVPGRMHTHGYWAKKHYNKPVAKEGLVTLKHYRTCRKEWLKKNGDMCYKTIQRVRDTSMIPYAVLIRDEVLKVKHTLGIT